MLQKAICLFAPITLAFQVDVGSTIFVAEIVLPIVAIFLVVFRGKLSLHKYMQRVLIAAIFYLLAQIFSDLWNAVSYEQYSRGWGRILLFIINMVAIYVIVENKRSHLILFVLGMAAGRILVTLSGLQDEIIPWKIGISKPVAMIVIVTCVVLPLFKDRATYLAAMMLLGLGLFDIVMDFRSHGSVLVCVAVLLIGSAVLPNSVGRNGVRGLRPVLGISAAGLIAAFMAFQFYVFAAKSGWLSDAATNKFEVQVEQADAPLLVAGRSETLVYFEVIFDSILIGHGSWPRDPYYAEKLAIERYEKGLSRSLSRSADESIPIHSHFFGGWIEAGLAGASFWIYVVFLVAKSVKRSSIGSSPMRPLYFYGAMLLTWDIFFSPFSGFRRLETAFLIVIVLRSLLQRQGLRRSSRNRSRHKSRSSRHRRRDVKRSAIGSGATTATA